MPVRRAECAAAVVRALLLRAAVAAAIVVCLAFGYGLSERDRAALESFTGAVDRWQSHPEFRALAGEYSVAGSAALRTRPLGVGADRLIIAARSCPLLPERYALNSTCRLHYEQFGGGPLSAYLHLCDEQAVHHVVGMVETLARKYAEAPGPGGGPPGSGGGRPDDAALAEFLAAFKLDHPVAKDAGALQSVASLVRDTGAAARPFEYRAAVGRALSRHARGLAGELGFPADVARMTVPQQRAVLDRLDAYVRRRDPELWRTKQVSDFCAGIWAHVFGRNYTLIMKPYLALHAVCRLAVWPLLLWAAVRWLAARRGAGSGEHAFAVGGASGAGGAGGVAALRLDAAAAAVSAAAPPAHARGPRRRGRRGRRRV